MYPDIGVAKYPDVYIFTYINIIRYAGICKYERISINICQYILFLSDYCGPYMLILEDLGIFIRKYLKIFEYFFVLSEEKPNFVRR